MNESEIREAFENTEIVIPIELWMVAGTSIKKKQMEYILFAGYKSASQKYQVEIKELKQRIIYKNNVLESDDKLIKELEQQIEKNKNCSNCGSIRICIKKKKSICGEWKAEGDLAITCSGAGQCDHNGIGCDENNNCGEYTRKGE